MTRSSRARPDVPALASHLPRSAHEVTSPLADLSVDQIREATNCRIKEA
jgi:hypothetical protein